MGDMTSGQKQSSKYTKNAVNTLQGVKSDLTQNPLYLAGRALASQFLANPNPYTDQVKQSMIARATDAAQGSYTSGLKDLWEKAGAAGGYRSGLTRGQEQELARGMGQTRADIVRSVDEAAAGQQVSSQVAALNSMAQLLGIQYQPEQSIANAYVGASSNPVWQQPSPTAQAAGGAGQLLSTTLAPTGMIGKKLK